jgi:hypothetical protein
MTIWPTLGDITLRVQHLDLFQVTLWLVVETSGNVSMHVGLQRVLWNLDKVFKNELQAPASQVVNQQTNCEDMRQLAENDVVCMRSVVIRDKSRVYE